MPWQTLAPIPRIQKCWRQADRVRLDEVRSNILSRVAQHQFLRSALSYLSEALHDKASCTILDVNFGEQAPVPQAAAFSSVTEKNGHPLVRGTGLLQKPLGCCPSKPLMKLDCPSNLCIVNKSLAINDGVDTPFGKGPRSLSAYLFHVSRLRENSPGLAVPACAAHSGAC